MFIRNLLFCALAGLLWGAISAGEPEENVLSQEDSFKLVSESSKVRAQCLRHPNWLSPKGNEGCNLIARLFRQQMHPKTENDRLEDALCAHDSLPFGVLRRTANSKALKDAICDILPEETPQTRDAEYDYVVRAYHYIPEILKNIELRKS